MPALRRDELRDDDGDRLVRLAAFDDLLDIPEQRFDKKAERRIEDHQTRSLPPGLPLLLDFFRFLRIQGNVDSGHIVGKKLGVAQSLQRSLVHSTDRHNDAMTRVTGGQAVEFVQSQMSGKVFIVTMNGKEKLDQYRNNDQYDPGAFPEFGHSKDHHDDRRAERAKSIDKHLKAPTFIVAQG